MYNEGRDASVVKLLMYSQFSFVYKKTPRVTKLLAYKLKKQQEKKHFSK